MVYPDYKLSPDTKLISKDIILTSENNKRDLIVQLCNSPQPQNVCMFGEDPNMFEYEELDVSI